MSEPNDKIAMATAEDVARYAPPPEGEPVAAPAAPASAEAERIAALEKELADCREKLLRAQAECANISRRLQQQHAEDMRLAGKELARALLPVLDNFERTLASLPETSADDPVATGVRLIAREMQKVLRDFGVEAIEAVGRPFDPKCHEALLHDRGSTQPAGTVTQELQRGYRMHDRVLRPARVAVAGGDEAAPPADAAAPSAGPE
jgi:molecular chaperone GrpE